MPTEKTPARPETPTAPPLVEVRRSGIHGKGVYATAPIKKGARIIEYTGKHIPWKTAVDEAPRDPSDPYHTFLFSLDNGDVIDAAKGGNDSRWINHSCDPNCETAEEDSRIFIDAIRALKKGDELFYDYRIVPAERRTKALEKEFACLCGTAKCRGTMLEPRPRKRRRAAKKKAAAKRLPL